MKREKFTAIGIAMCGKELDEVSAVEVIVERDGDLFFNYSYVSFSDFSFQGFISRLGFAKKLMRHGSYVQSCEYVFNLVSKNKIICRTKKDIQMIKNFFYANKRVEYDGKKKFLFTPEVVSIEEDVMEKKRFVPMTEMIKKSCFSVGQLQEITCEMYDLEYLDDIQPSMFRACATLAIYLNDRFNMSYEDILNALVEQETEIIPLEDTYQPALNVPAFAFNEGKDMGQRIVNIPAYRLNTY